MRLSALIGWPLALIGAVPAATGAVASLVMANGLTEAPWPRLAALLTLWPLEALAFVTGLGLILMSRVPPRRRG